MSEIEKSNGAKGNSDSNGSDRSLGSPDSNGSCGEERIDECLLAVMLREKIHNEKPVKIVKVDKAEVMPKGENFASSVYRVSVHCILANGRKKVFSLIVKMELKKLKDVTTNQSSYFLFRQETHAYTRILSHMELLMNEFDDKRETLWAEFYGYEPYHTVVLEDLNEKRYFTCDRRTMLEVDDVKLVMRSLGRFHAMSIVLKSRAVINDDDKGKCQLASDNNVIECLYRSGLTLLIDAVEEGYGEGWKEVAERLRAQLPILHEKLKELSQTYDPKFEVLNHGDLWNCNVMMKRMEYTKAPVSVKFVDYQVMHLNSFIWDIAQFLNTSMQPKTLRDNRGELMKAYHESLETNLKFFDFDGYVPLYEDVMSETRRLLYADFAFRIIVRSVITFTLPKGWDLKALITKAPEEALNKECFTHQDVIGTIKEDLLWFKEQNAF